MKNKTLAIIEERELDRFKELAYLRHAAKRILVDVERGEEKIWEDIRRKYKLKEDALSINLTTGEIIKK